MDTTERFLKELEKFCSGMKDGMESIFLTMKVKYTEIRASQAASEAFARRLANWKDIPFNIAIVGSSGSGKSSFINAIRNITADDEGGAAVDVNECTKEPTPYCHPTNGNLKLWDLPGVGTPNFPKDSEYLENVKFNRYDFFLIFSSTRFTEDDNWLAEQIQSKNKIFFS